MLSVKSSRYNIVIVKSLRGSVWKTILAIRSIGKWVILAALLIHAGAWVMLANVKVSPFHPDFPTSIFGRPANRILAENIFFAALFAAAFSLVTLIIFVPFVLIDISSVANWVRSIVVGQIKQGYCSVCGYDLTGNTSGVCPECGTVVAGKAGA